MVFGVILRLRSGMGEENENNSQDVSFVATLERLEGPSR